MAEPSQPRFYSTGFSTLAAARHPWPADCFIQGGGDGIVLQSGSMNAALADPEQGVEAVAAALGLTNPTGSYRTAFFEAFPKRPITFLRGEGKTLTEAEDACWRDWQQVLACPGHEFERRHYRTGSGICKHCGMFSSSAFATTIDPCVLCGDYRAEMAGGPDRHGRWHCKRCFRLIPEEGKSDIHLRLDKMRRRE